MTSLEDRVQLLEDIEEIRRLKIKYAQICDTGYDGTKLAALFTEDAVWDGGQEFGVVNGKQEIKEMFNAMSNDLTFALHYMIGHTIDVDPSGTSAKAHWYLWEPMTYQGRAILNAITYDDECKKVNGEWLISRMALTFHFLTPYEDGWVKTRMVTEG